MNEHEARLAIRTLFRDLLVDLAEDDDEEVEGFEDAMGEVANILLESCDLEVVSVDAEGKITATLTIPEYE